MTHETPNKPKRRYSSAHRLAQARETRQRIEEAARRLLTQRGYAGTTMEAIAQEAGVAVETVYATFRSKRALVTHLVELAVTGDDASETPGSLLERPEAQSIQQLRDQRQQIRAFAGETRAIMGRIGPLFEILRGAAAAEAEMATLLQNLLQQRYDALAQFTEWVADNGPLRAGLSGDEAVDLIWTLASPEVYHLLAGRGWTQERYERWLGDTLITLLLPPL